MYRKMYLLLFNAITDALRAISAGRLDVAVSRLTGAQEEAEALYMGGTAKKK